MTSGPEQFQFAGQPDDSDEIRRLTLTANHRIRQAYYAGEAEGENRASKDPSRSLVRRDSYMGGFAAGQEAKAHEMEEALRRQRHDDQRVWLEAFLPLLPEDKREQYREQIRVAQAAESLTPKENGQ